MKSDLNMLQIAVTDHLLYNQDLLVWVCKLDNRSSKRYAFEKLERLDTYQVPIQWSINSFDDGDDDFR